mmetsp:Transcript_3538/g.7308  ORF Transcript_3538/g.7308 Transcript_3538/m.7308 type:complete len:91 (-) Transcript_3538:46-318(-)
MEYSTAFLFQKSLTKIPILCDTDAVHQNLKEKSQWVKVRIIIMKLKHNHVCLGSIPHRRHGKRDPKATRIQYPKSHGGAKRVDFIVNSLA